MRIPMKSITHFEAHARRTRDRPLAREDGGLARWRQAARDRAVKTSALPLRADGRLSFRIELR